jgi:hypothetical protein
LVKSYLASREAVPLRLSEMKKHASELLIIFGNAHKICGGSRVGCIHLCARRHALPPELLLDLADHGA